MYNCKICSQPAQGNHFGVPSCRACAAFFRRGSQSLYKYKCSSGLGNCLIFEAGQLFCKRCRLERCIAEGMDEKKFQHDRDLNKTAQIVPISSNQIKRKLPYTSDAGPAWIVLNSDSSGKTRVELKHLLNQARAIFEKSKKPVHGATSVLHTISRAVNSSREFPNFWNTRKINKYGRYDMAREWERSFLMVANWLRSFEAFQDLNTDLKMEILKTIWHVWKLIDRLAINAVARKRGMCSEKEMLVGYQLLVDLDKWHFDIDWFTNYPKQNRSFFIDDIDWMLLNLIPSMIALSPTDIELTYMTLQLCFNYAGKRLKNEMTLTVFDGFLDVLSDDLHRYYVEEREMPRYSTRLAQMMRMNREIEKDIVEKRWKYEVGRVFDVWNIEFSHPEVFQDNSC